MGSFVNNHNLPAQPYYSKYGGVVLYDWAAEFTTGMAMHGDARDHIMISPNPTPGTVLLTELIPNASLRVVDALGRMLMDLQAPKATMLLDLKGNAPGLYTISEHTCSGTRSARVLLLPE